MVEKENILELVNKKLATELMKKEIKYYMKLIV